MKKLLSLLLLNLFLFNAKAQESNDYRRIVGVAKFSATDVRQERFSDAIAERVLDVLNQQNRFQVIDLDGKARKQAINVSQENYKSENWIEDNKSLSAENTLTGVLTSLKFIRLNAGKGYKAAVTYTIKIIDTQSGEIIENGTATFSSTKSDIKLTPESALQSAIETTIPGLKEYFSKSFPIKIDLLRIEKEKKNKALVVLLGGGSKMGLQEKQKFEVYTIDNSLGKPLPKILGEVKITKILSEDYCEAKVVKGNREILASFKEEKKIICKSLKND